MTGEDETESARTAREARDRTPGARSTREAAVWEALHRYLKAEAGHRRPGARAPRPPQQRRSDESGEPE